MTPEGRVKADIKRLLKGRRIWHYSPVSNGMGVHGIPDFVCCWNGSWLGVEAKAPGKLANVSRVQNYQFELIRKSGGTVLVVDDVTQLKEFLDA